MKRRIKILWSKTNGVNFSHYVEWALKKGKLMECGIPWTLKTMKNLTGFTTKPDRTKVLTLIITTLKHCCPRRLSIPTRKIELQPKWVFRVTILQKISSSPLYTNLAINGWVYSLRKATGDPEIPRRTILTRRPFYTGIPYPQGNLSP